MTQSPRKIVLIIGNGFDLDLGRKTMYKDFWESEFCPKDYPAPLIYHLNQRWSNNLEAVRWYDLETELLNYYKGIVDPEKGVDFMTEEERAFLCKYDSFRFRFGQYEDKGSIIQSLVNKGALVYYNPQVPDILDEYKKDCHHSPIWRDKKALRLINDGLCQYLRSISEAECDKKTLAPWVLMAVNQAREKGGDVNIYSFNYTPLPADYGNGFMDIVHYVHGSCKDGGVIIGTRDDAIFNENYDFLQKSFDKNYNPPAIVTDLLEADDVIVFGHSLGENDRQYFKAFFMQQVDYSHPKHKTITIFTQNDVSEIAVKRSLQKMTEYNLATLYCLNKVKIYKTDDIYKRPEPFKLFLENYITEYGYIAAAMNDLNQSAE